MTNARPHLSSDVVVNVDLSDFFPTVSYKRVKGLFRCLGYSESAATVFSLLCTEPETVPVELDGVTYHVALGQRFLPQGAPSSPALTNLICRRMDRRLTGVADKLQYTYTRYADDLTFSASGPAAQHVGRLLRQVRWVVEKEGFAVHPDKTRVLRRSRRQEVTGVVVNGEKPSIERAVLRRFRAVLYQIEKDGPEGKRWGAGGDVNVVSSVYGYASYVHMVDPDKGGPLLKRAEALVGRYGRPQPPPRPRRTPSWLKTPAAQEPAQQGAAPEPAQPEAEQKEEKKDTKKKWWKIF